MGSGMWERKEAPRERAARELLRENELSYLGKSMGELTEETGAVLIPKAPN